MPSNLSDCERDAVHRAKLILTEHFDNVAIFANRTEEDGSTSRVELASGNWFALIYHLDNWLANQPSGFDNEEASSELED